MPVYHGNTTHEFTVALNSIISQTYPASQIVIVQDGPVEEGISLQLNSLKSLKEVKLVILPTNTGVGNALNVGLQHCDYEWIARMDADDKSLPNRFEETVNFITKNPELDLIGGYYAEQPPKGHIYVRKVPAEFKGILKFSKYRNPHSHPTVFYKKNAVVEAGGYKNFYFAEDWYLWLRMFAKGSKSANITQVVVYAQGQNYSRRLGLRALRNDFRAMASFWRERLIGFNHFVINIFVRSLVRLLPFGWATTVYKNFLRSAADD